MIEHEEELGKGFEGGAGLLGGFMAILKMNRRNTIHRQMTDAALKAISKALKKEQEDDPKKDER